jgi:hypothetical protein
MHKNTTLYLYYHINIHIFWILLKWLGESREKSLLSLSWKLRLSTRVMCDTIFTIASTGRYKDIGKDGNTLPLQNTCVTNDHGYVPLVVRTFWSFSHSLLISVFVTGATRRVSLVEQKLLTLPEHVSSPPILSFMCSLLYNVVCSFFFFFLLSALCCLSFFDLRIRFTPLISSNSSYKKIDCCSPPNSIDIMKQ